MKVLISDKMAEEAIQVLKDAGHDITYEEYDADTLLKEIPKHDALMVRSRTKATSRDTTVPSPYTLECVSKNLISL